LPVLQAVFYSHVSRGTFFIFSCFFYDFNLEIRKDIIRSFQENNRMDRKIKKPHLGRGLEALLGSVTFPSSAAFLEEEMAVAETKPSFPPDKELERSKNEIPISCIVPNPFQPRTAWNEESLKELAQSIRCNGILQPIIVRPSGEQYEVIAGERRLRAAQIAGLSVVPVVVRLATDQQMLELALVENIHRSDLNPVERAKAYHNYITTFNLSQIDASERLGEDRSVVANHLRLLDLPQEIKDMLITGQLSMGHARAILALPTDQLRNTLANKALAGRLNVRDVERLVRKFLEDNHKTTPEKKQKAANIVDLERRLQEILGTKVRIEGGRRASKGRIVIEYYSLDDFERLTERIGLRNKETT
jgi:ParB family chromosome partitioning protein